MLPGAILFLLPVVVVDVTGDRLDPAHTRELVEHELSVTAVAPDDPRAANASGRIEVSGNASDKKLTVKYRKLDEPVERTIDLADDASRAESDAALLAGNLARDEASELAPPPADPPPPKAQMPQLTKKPVESVSSFLWSAEDRSLAQMRAFVDQSEKEENASRARSGAVQMAVAGALIAPAIYLYATRADSAEAKVFANGATTVGAMLLASGLVTMVIDSGEFKPIKERFREHDKNGTDSREAREDIEKEWANRADAAKSRRSTWGWVSIGVATAFLALGTAGLVTSENPTSSFGVTFAGLGGVWLVNGVSMLMGETATERSYRMWRTVTSTPSTGTNVSFGATVLPGGGGAASFALTF